MPGGTCCTTVDPAQAVFGGLRLGVALCVLLYSLRKCCHDHELPVDGRRSCGFDSSLDFRPETAALSVRPTELLLPQHQQQHMLVSL